jgi:hypothetical protein
MNYEKLERIESLLTFYSAANLREAIEEIANILLNDGFENEDVKEYIQIYVDLVLGK